MLKLIDRLLVLGYLKAYVICLVSLLSLYVVVDLFTNLDEFTYGNPGLVVVLKRVGTYYGFKFTHIYDRLSEAIVLLAAVFTVAWMQRNNELIPLLSAGVSTRRVVLPIILTAVGMLGLTLVNQELIQPNFGSMLALDREYKENDIPIQGAFEPNGIHIEGTTAARDTQTIHKFFCTIPEGLAPNMIHLHAKEARYVPPSDDPRSGGWLLRKAQPEVIENWDKPEVLEQIDKGKYFLRVRELTFDAVTRRPKWYNFASTVEIYTELQKPDSTRLSTLAVLFHARLTRPIMGFLLVVMGLAVILRDQNRNIFVSAGECLILSAAFFGLFFTCKSLGDNDLLPPALAAWLPVLLTGPATFVLYDAVHT